MFVFVFFESERISECMSNERIDEWVHESHCVITIPKESFIMNMGNHSLVIGTDVVP